MNRGLDENGVLTESRISKTKADFWTANYFQNRTYEYDLKTDNDTGATYLTYTSPTIEKSLRESVRDVLLHEGNNVIGITGDCGFFMNLQDKIDDISYEVAGELGIVPPNVMMSSLLQLAFIQQTIGRRRKVAVVTANANSFMSQYENLLPWGSRTENVVVVGMEDVDGFGDEVAKGLAIKPIAGENIIKKLRSVIETDSTINGILMECTELPFISDKVRKEFNMVVVDSLSMLDFLYQSQLGSFLP